MFRSEHATVGWPVMSHASYLINICAADPVILKRSRDALEDEMLRAEELGIDYVVLHPGAHMGAGRELGIEAAAASLSDLHDRTRGVRVRLLLEITAGQGSCLGCRFDDIADILDAARGADTLGRLLRHLPRPRVGDGPQHRRGLRARVRRASRARIGLDRLRAFHLNDSKTPAGSRVDRHAEIGDGYLGLLPFWRLVNDPRFATTPAVLETPSGADKLPSFARNLARLRALIGAPRPPGPPKSQALPEKIDPRQGRLFA